MRSPLANGELPLHGLGFWGGNPSESNETVIDGLERGSLAAVCPMIALRSMRLRRNKRNGRGRSDDRDGLTR